MHSVSRTLIFLCLEVLERIGSPQALELLRRLRKDAPSAAVRRWAGGG